MKTFVPVVDKKFPLRNAVYDAFRKRSPLISKAQAYDDIARKFNISVSTVQRYIKKIETGAVFDQVAKKQGRHIYAWDDEALSFFNNFYLVAIQQVGGCTVRNAYNCTKNEAKRQGWSIGSEQSAYVHAKKISPAMLMLAKGGQRALDNMFYISRDLSKLKPFQMIVGDQHIFDFWCIGPNGKQIRAECYLWLDMATRLVYGASFDIAYNTYTVTRALRMGIKRFGKFESTYNDNGSSEKSKLADQIVERLQSYGVKFLDEADLYHAENGRYIVEDTEGLVVDVVPTKAEWEKKHRRIFARVKNAKTKPIERFFSTLEQILLDMCTPGRVKGLAVSAPEEEQATRRLDWQKKNGYILTYDDFIRQVLKAIDIYETRVHQTLGCSPRERLSEYKKDGWIPTFIDPRDESYLFMESTTRIVKGDRIELNGIEYVGPDLTQEMVLQNRGTLVAYNRHKIEIRYDPENLDLGVFAIEPGTNNAIALRPVEKIDMLDSDSMVKQLEWKKRNMKAVQEAFQKATENKNIRLLSEPNRFEELHKAEELSQNALEKTRQTEHKKPALELQKPVVPRKIETKTEEREVPLSLNRRKEISQEDFLKDLASRIGNENVLRAHGKPVFLTDRDRYQYLLNQFYSGERLSREDMDFKFAYEAKMTKAEENYFDSYVKGKFN
ncbi:Mu transposase C-terminal domain-containing protein [Treponema pectinovorum]|uniref:Mu transposase C-terminal domain-containing protein n=1 Tax=Treponema pectinovorum TaxID=164 RepID=UPI0011CB90A4|nr:Mu transposase C-terminal domain-containing protein [Treponema pectinovorum]